jgi:TolB-like protein/tetratricopeptide (TPR) repeat protein
MSTAGNGKIFRFGPYEVDRDRADLRKHGVRLRIQDQPLHILIALLDNAGEIVTREELVQRVWPSGSFVDFEHGLNAAVNRLRQVLNDSVESPRYIETVPRRGYCFIGQVEREATAKESSREPVEAVPSPKPNTSARTDDTPSLAVLPFANLSPGPDSDYFSDGLAEEIINALTGVNGLRVIARASASVFRNRTIPLREVAERLGVGLVLDGSFRRLGGRIRVTAQLVDGAGQSCLWSESYDRKLIDVLDVQEDIARSIVNTLKLRVTSGQLIRRYTANEDVYLFYLKGHFYLHEWTADAVEHIYNYMNRVVALEPGYAMAWVELAHAALGRVLLGAHPAEAMSEGLEAAKRAVAVDPNLAESHGALGYLKGIYQHDWPGARSEFRVALQLNAASPSIHFWYAMVLIAIGRVAEATAELHRSLEADPLSVLTNMLLCRQHTICGDYDEAIARGKRAVHVGPFFYPAMARLGEAYLYAGEPDKGVELMERCRSQARVDGWYTGALASAYCRTGRKEKAEAMLQELEDKRRKQYVASAVLAFTSAAVGEADRAFEYFRQSVEDRDPILYFTATERSLDPIRHDARYPELLASMNIPANSRLIYSREQSNRV